ncbi:MAG: 4a-hydroxytetrahydrobiopterin dehydratase [Gordonia sp. (in: high G+C Gram-positive bacteria)]|uniref:4a-hydroxytetrahydrobiopterin dehydratase n=1 Tax=Gordonia sp. (in: high G+C Gram-positive bacteria) TaxID=84139 RepID=UPI0039E54B05
MSAAEAEASAPEPWRVVDGRLSASFRTASMVRGLEFVNRIVGEAEAADHHPDIDFRYGTVGLSLITHAIDGLSDADIALAETISRIAAELEIEPA